jgi:transcription elongation GreA/GreB family factor
LRNTAGAKSTLKATHTSLFFANPIQAVRWAVEVQISHATDPIVTPLGPLLVRIGIHIGNPLPKGDNLVGYDVHYASRVAAFGNGGQILLSEVMAALVRAASIRGWRVHRHGERDFKGIGNEPIFELLYADKQPQPLKDEPAIIKVAPDTKQKNQKKETQRVTSGIEKRQRTRIRMGFLMPLLLVPLLGVVAIFMINPAEISNLCDVLPICAEDKWKVKYDQADKQAKIARDLAQTRDYDDLKKASEQLEKAIKQLEEIPPNATIYPEVEQVLPRYKQEIANLKQKQNKMQYEWKVKHDEADNQAKIARDLAQKAKDYNDLKKASEQLEEAIKQFEAIPSNATIYPQVQKVLLGYKQELAKLKLKQKIDLFKPQKP